MASAQKRPKLGLFKDDITPSLHYSMAQSIHASGSPRLQTTAPVKKGMSLTFKTAWRGSPESTLITPAAAPPLSQKRSREEDLEPGKLAKQARRDWADGARLERSRRLLISTPLAVPKATPMNMDRVKIPCPLRIHAEGQRLREYVASASVAPEKLRVSIPAFRHDPAPVKAKDCGYPPPKALEVSPTAAENVISEPAVASQDLQQNEKTVAVADASPPPAQSAAEAQKLAELAQQNEVLKRELEAENEIARSKSGQVLRLIKAHTEQKNELGSQIKALQEQLDESKEALRKNKAAYNDLQTKHTKLDNNARAEVSRLESEALQIKEERKDAVSMKESAQAEVNRLNDRNSYLQKSARNAADAELKAGNKYTQLQMQYKQAREDLQTAEADRDQAVQERVAAKEDAKKMKSINFALVEALSVHGFIVSKAVHRINANTDMESENVEHERIPWEDLVEPNVFYKPLDKPSKLFGTNTDTVGFGKAQTSENGGMEAAFEQYSRTKGAKSAFGQPSVPSSQTTTSFGKPSMVVAAQPQQGNSAPDYNREDLERSLFQLSCELAETKQLSSELQAWAAKQDGNEQSAVPISLNQRFFHNYINNMVADSMANRMVSSGEAHGASFGDDTGMADAPDAATSILSTAHVDFANAKTFGPDGWPMQADDHTYGKSASRQNHKTPNDRGGKQKNKDGRNNNDYGYAPFDPAAGKRNGLDVNMGNSEHYKSFEAGMFSNNRKRKHDGDHGRSNKSKGNNNRSKNNRGRGANNNNRGQGGFNGNSNSNSNQSCGGRGGRGRGSGRGSRGGGRGGRGSGGSFDNEDDTMAGAAAESPLDDENDGDKMLAVSSIPLGSHQTSLLQGDAGNTYNEGDHLIVKAPVLEDDDLSDEDIMMPDSLQKYQTKWTKKQKMVEAPVGKSFLPGFNSDRGTPYANGKASPLPLPKHHTPRSSTPQGPVPTGPRAPSKMPRHNQPSGPPPRAPRSNYVIPVSQPLAASDPEERRTLASMIELIEQGPPQLQPNHYGDDRVANQSRRRAAKEQQRRKG